VAVIMNRELAGKIVFSDAVEYDSWWCNRLFDQTPLNVNFQWGNYWSRVSKKKPPSMHVPDSYDWHLETSLMG